MSKRRHVTLEKKIQIVEDYRAGVTIGEIATKHGVLRSTVYYTLGQSGAIKKPEKQTDDVSVIIEKMTACLKQLKSLCC